MAEDAAFRILLVDDEPVIGELVRAMFSTSTTEIDIATNGMACLKKARDGAFDLILLDIVLPGIDGIAVCRLLKADPCTAHVPVYMLTAKARQRDVETAKFAGADGYINKPFKGAELIDLVAQLRGQSSSE